MINRHLNTRLLNPAWVGSLYYWFYWSIAAIYTPFLNVYLAELGLSGAEIGILSTIVPLMSLVAAPLVSAYADRKQRRIRILQLFLAAWAVVLFFLRIPTTFLPIMLLMVVKAFFRSPTIGLGDSIIARMAERQHLQYGALRLWGSAGFAAVTIVMGLLWQRAGYGSMFALAGLAAIPAILLAGRLQEGTAVAAHEHRPARDLLRDKGLLIIFSVSFLAGGAIVITFIFGGIHIVKIGGSSAAVGLLFGLSALAEVPSMRRSEAIIERLGGAKTVLLATIILSITIFWQGWAWSPTLMIVAAVAKGFGYGLFFVGQVHLITERAPAEWASTAQSLNYAGMLGLAPLLASAIGGFMYDLWGGGWLFTVAAAASAGAALLLAWAIARGWFEAPLTIAGSLGSRKGT